MDQKLYDLCVVGGGINGAGIARDAAGRGMSVILLEADDLGSGTSGASTKLIHGGLRYLENYEFSMVRAALKEREILLHIAPHLIWPINIVIPHSPSQRSRWMIRAGLFLYDHLGGRSSVERSRAVDLVTNPAGKPLKPEYKNGFSYGDAWGDDTRLVVVNALDAAERGAKIYTRTACTGLKQDAGYWHISARDTRSDDALEFKAARVVNATGPWVGQFLNRTGLDRDDPALPKVRLVKGSHIIVDKQFEGKQLYLLQQPDGRVVFVIPYEGRFTLIGTTEEGYQGDPKRACISDAESAYLCNAYNAAFSKSIGAKDVRFHYSGVRPLLDDGRENASKVTRDYRIYHHKKYDAPLLSVFGGKLTTYRVLAEDVVDQLMHISGRPAAGWTFREPLPGGEILRGDFSLFLEVQTQSYPWLPTDVLHRYARSYGARMDDFLFDKVSLAGLGYDFGGGVYEVELRYLREKEWAQTAEDVLWRRSKLGLYLVDKTVSIIEDYFSSPL